VKEGFPDMARSDHLTFEVGDKEDPSQKKVLDLPQGHPIAERRMKSIWVCRGQYIRSDLPSMKECCSLIRWWISFFGKSSKKGLSSAIKKRNL
jgi:hypothetical protein